MEEWNWQVLSDIHLEFYDKHDKGKVHPSMFMDVGLAPNLALCGDIGYPTRPAYRAFLDWCSNNYKTVFVVAGNHEYYTSKLAEPKSEREIDTEIDSICKRFPNVFFLQKRAVQLPEGRVLGCTLWSYIAPQNRLEAERYMNDYTLIPDWSVDLQRRRHLDHVQWLTSEIDHSETHDEPTVILTHHLPSYALIHREYRTSHGNYNFASHLDHLIKPPLLGWFCGHTHKQMEYCHNGVHVLTNPIGYPNENNLRNIRNKWVMFTQPKRTRPFPPDLPKTPAMKPSQNGKQPSPPSGAGSTGRKPSEDIDFI